MFLKKADRRSKSLNRRLAHVGQPFLTVGHNLALSVAFEANDPINLLDAINFVAAKIFSTDLTYYIYSFDQHYSLNWQHSLDWHYSLFFPSPTPTTPPTSGL